MDSRDLPNPSELRQFAKETHQRQQKKQRHKEEAEAQRKQKEAEAEADENKLMMDEMRNRMMMRSSPGKGKSPRTRPSLASAGLRGSSSAVNATSRYDSLSPSPVKKTPAVVPTASPADVDALKKENEELRRVRDHAHTLHLVY